MHLQVYSHFLKTICVVPMTPYLQKILPKILRLQLNVLCRGNRFSHSCDIRRNMPVASARQEAGLNTRYVALHCAHMPVGSTRQEHILLHCAHCRRPHSLSNTKRPSLSLGYCISHHVPPCMRLRCAVTTRNAAARLSNTCASDVYPWIRL